MSKPIVSRTVPEHDMIVAPIRPTFETMRVFLEELNGRRLRSYAEDPGLLKEHHGIEQTVLAGGYGYRQILELVQNGADAILEAHEQGLPSSSGNRIHVLLRNTRLYVANTGAPLSNDGVDALLRSHSSPKRGNQIGRFGLGFKSLLRLDGRIDLFTRTSGAIRFDPQRCRDELKERFNVADTPGLRLAWHLDESEREEDSTCNDLVWAETIVRVDVRANEIQDHLRQEISAFPAEFLLFFPVRTVLVLDDGEHPARELSIEPDGDDLVLHDGAEVSRWRVARRELHITEARALADATHIHGRVSVPLAWAMPLEGKREEAGRFWAFFPTHTPTYLPGILNAPWKLNSDRNAIIGGEWNSALMAEAACLIADTLVTLSSPDDPARPLDAFPRQMERKDEDAAPLVEALWKALENTDVIPDAHGVQRGAKSLWRHTRDSVELARRWQALAAGEDAARFVHPSCLERQRSSRLNALAERLNAQNNEQTPAPYLRRVEAKLWFDVVASSDMASASQVLSLAEAYASECKPHDWQAARPLLAIIPSQNGALMTANEVILAPDGVSVPGRATVASAFYENEDTRRILKEVMQVKTLDDGVWASVLRESLSIPSYPSEAQDAGWKVLWARLRLAPQTARDRFVKEYRGRIKVRRCEGTWVLADEALLPGTLIPRDDTHVNHQKLLVDMKLHGSDGPLLIALGTTDFPEGNESNIDVGLGLGLGEWLTTCRNTYKETHDNSASWSYLKPSELKMPKGFYFLPQLMGTANAKLTERYLARIAKGEFSEQLKFGHSTVPTYPKIDVPHPLPWFVLRHGMIQVGDNTVRLVAMAIVARRQEPALAMWQGLLQPLLKIDQTNPPIRVTQDDIRTVWLALIETLATPAAMTQGELDDLWSGAAKDGVIPDTIRTPAGEIPLSQVFVTGSPDIAHRVRSPERVVIVLDEETLKLWVSKGARNLSELLKPKWASTMGPAALLISVIPDLRNVVSAGTREIARCQPVSELKLCMDNASDLVSCLLWENTLLLDQEQLSRLSRAQRMNLLVKEVAAAGWLDCQPEEALRRLGDLRVEELRATVARGATLAERLLRAVGGCRQPLQEALGALRCMSFVQECTKLQLAELTLAQLGPATLPAIRETLAEEGLKPPSRWNTSEARDFVTSIGFPGAFAASPETRRDAEEFISGPIELPPLHDFQQEVLEGVGNLLATGTGRRRAVVSLPTGGGKTRVTVEAAVRLVLAPDGNRRTVVWVAQTDELCEQAVQAFRQVWLNLGAQRTDLRIVRLWGGNPNPAVQDTGKPVVVVASIQTLNSRMGTDELAWLNAPGLVVVDECHHAITPSYTNLLRWLNAEAPRQGAPEKEEPPILGLSATPFRTDDEESQRLAKRFDNRWFPADQEQLHSRLHCQGVLSSIAYESLESGVGLLEEEIARLYQLSDTWEGLDFENILEAINQRLAGDAQRNQRLIACIQRSEEKAILFFTNSVLHAEEMSARLNLSGISATAISGSTPTVARRYFLDRFQRGEIRVLCNHSVLTTGFDAPKTDMVLIARQVFSPVRYMQMVGRGLRGEKNGGTANCRIVTVVDNLGRYQDRHPYHYCKRYFTEINDKSTRVFNGT